LASSRYAVISVGTNSCRLLLASGDANALRVDYHEARGTRLGEGVDASGGLHPDAVRRTLAAVRDYAELARGARVFGIGTSALRDAKDAHGFADQFAQQAGTPLVILSGEEEAASSFEGAACGLKAAGRKVPPALCVIDVGGGSTEFGLRARAGERPAYASLQIGAVRLTEKFFASDPPTSGQIEQCRQAIRSALHELEGSLPRGTVVAVGGTANTAARMLQLVDESAIAAVADIPAADLGTLLKVVLSMPTRDRKRLHGLPEQRADIFPAGLMIIEEAVTIAGAATLVVSESDLLLGYAARHL
jgi:exopolyphosphatase/guanosine-5'-triphosphate,3'-diphosphate pyrophosphatase